jgi:hypothetical protein
MQKSEIREKYNLSKSMVNQLVWEGHITQISGQKWKLDGEYFKDFNIEKYREKFYKESKEKQRKSLSKSVKLLWDNEEYRNQQSNSHSIQSTNLWKDDAYRQKQKIIRKEIWSNLNRRQEQSNKIKQVFNTEEMKEKLSKGQLQRFSNVEERNKISMALKKAYESKELRDKISRLTKEALGTPEMRQKMSINTKLGQKKSGAIEKISLASKFMWQNPAHINKIYETKKKNNSFNTSSTADACVKEFKEFNFTIELEKPYPNEENLHCDIYIKDLDLWIELHYTWTHGGRPYDENSEDCKKQLNIFNDKAKTSDYYKNAIYQWTDLDVRKRENAKRNSLNYLCFYNKKDFYNYFYNLVYKDIKENK